MSPRPKTVTGAAAEGALARILLTWEPLPWEPLVDHFRVYGAPGEDAPDVDDEEQLVGRTVYPRFEHRDLDLAGETWTYRVLAVSDAGRRGRASDPVTAASTPSVTTTGEAVATIGEVDGRTLEHHLAPGSYARIPEAHPDALIEYVDGEDTPGEAWPYLLPGPLDAWAGSRSYRARWTLTLEAAPTEDHDLALWFVDTTRKGGTLQVTVNETHLEDLELAIGATRGSREGDATAEGSPLVRSFHELPVPASMLRAGENVIGLEITEGAWAAWDALGLYARR